MLGFRTINLLIPGDPPSLEVSTLEGPWTLEIETPFEPRRKAIVEEGKCQETYLLMNEVSLASGSAKVDAAFDELLPLCLGASFLTGLAVTIQRALPGSEVTPLALSHRFPRARSLGPGWPCISSATAFGMRLENFVRAFPTAGAIQKVTVIVHHWLDALACWSLEDLYLSATTELQVIAATEETIQGKGELWFFDAVEGAAKRVGISPLQADFKNMRNDLIHDGRLSASRFPKKTAADCATVAAEVLNWIDQYIHAVLGLGPVEHVRFSPANLQTLNAYSF